MTYVIFTLQESDIEDLLATEVNDEDSTDEATEEDADVPDSDEEPDQVVFVSDDDEDELEFESDYESTDDKDSEDDSLEETGKGLQTKVKDDKKKLIGNPIVKKSSVSKSKISAKKEVKSVNELRNKKNQKNSQKIQTRNETQDKSNLHDKKESKNGSTGIHEEEDE